VKWLRSGRAAPGMCVAATQDRVPPGAPREAEVAELEMTVCGVQQVGELDVAVQHSLRVEERDGRQQLAHEALDLARGRERWGLGWRLKRAEAGGLRTPR
jgi:hypothetical protein